MARHFPYYLTTAVRLQNKNRMPGETLQKAVVSSNNSTQHTQLSGPRVLCATATQALSDLSQRGSSVVSSHKKQQHLKKVFSFKALYIGLVIFTTPESQVELILPLSWTENSSGDFNAEPEAKTEVLTELARMRISATFLSALHGHFWLSEHKIYLNDDITETRKTRISRRPKESTSTIPIIYSQGPFFGTQKC